MPIENHNATWAEQLSPPTTPAAGKWKVYPTADGFYFLDSADISHGPFNNNLIFECLIIACSDETTPLTTGTAKITFRMPFAMTLSEVRASVTIAPTGASVEVNINESGVAILSTILSIDATEKTSTTAITPAVISDTELADDAEITIDIDQVGATIAGAGLKVSLIGHRS